LTTEAAKLNSNTLKGFFGGLEQKTFGIPISVQTPKKYYITNKKCRPVSRAAFLVKHLYITEI